MLRKSVKSNLIESNILLNNFLIKGDNLKKIQDFNHFTLVSHEYKIVLKDFVFNLEDLSREKYIRQTNFLKLILLK